MEVNGIVKMNISLNINALETEAVKVDSYGKLVINDPEQFFIDCWENAWNYGHAELLGATNIECELDAAEG